MQNTKRRRSILRLFTVTVFNFPQIEAATTFPPFSTATNLYPDTINSLANTIIGIHDGIFPYPTNIISADKTKILSARGSKNFPNVVTSFLLLAMYPSNLSVIEAIIKIGNVAQTYYLYYDLDGKLENQTNDKYDKTGRFYLTTNGDPKVDASNFVKLFEIKV